VSGRILVVVRLDFDDLAPDAVDEEGRPDELGRNIVDAAVEEAPAQLRHARAAFAS
jgi:hypothetical protein